jgi:hypothetical protein
MGATNGAGTTYPSRAPEFTSRFSGVCAIRSLVICVCFADHCLASLFYYFLPLYCLFLDLRILIIPLVLSSSSLFFCPFLVIVLSLLRFRDSDYTFGILKFFFVLVVNIDGMKYCSLETKQQSITISLIFSSVEHPFIFDFQTITSNAIVIFHPEIKLTKNNNKNITFKCIAHDALRAIKPKFRNYLMCPGTVKI